MVGGGRPVFFLHAALSDGSQWDEILEAAPAGVRAASVDMPDFGYDAPGTTFATLERQLRAYLDENARGEPVTLVGHSLGAWVVARVLASAGERVRRAILIGGVPSLPVEMTDAYEGLAAGLEAGSVERREIVEAMVVTALGSATSPSLSDRITMLIGRYPDERLVRSLRLVASLGAPEAAVARFSVPTVVLHAEGDRSVPLSLARALADLADDGELEVWQSDSHMLPWTDPERTAALVYR